MATGFALCNLANVFRGGVVRRADRPPWSSPQRLAQWVGTLHCNKPKEWTHVTDATDMPDNVNAEPVVRGVKKVGRNDTCPCGSGKKFKMCCVDDPSHGMPEALPRVVTPPIAGPSSGAFLNSNVSLVSAIPQATMTPPLPPRI